MMLGETGNALTIRPATYNIESTLHKKAEVILVKFIMNCALVA